MGLLSTLAALNSFADTCFRDLSSGVSYVSMDKHASAGFSLLLVATILKVVDIWAHVIVPVPERDYWSPDTDCSDDESNSNSRTKKLIDPTQAKSDQFVATNQPV